MGRLAIVRYAAIDAQRRTEQRQAIALAYLAGFAHAQIATRLGLPLGTVKARIR